MQRPADPEDWNEDDFHTLLANAQCSNDYLAAILDNRSPASVVLVRQGVCDFHQGRANLLLTPMMLHELTVKKGRRACYVCDELF